MAAHLYWRVNILSCASGQYTAIPEISMASAAGGPNLLTGGTATADSYYAPTDENPSNAVDGNPSTTWTCLNGSGWWQYQLLTPAAVAEVKITARSESQDFANRSPSTWHLQYSDDGVTFTDSGGMITSQPWTAGMTQTFENTPYVAPLPGQHRWWRIFLPDIGNIFYNFAEIEFRESVGGPAVPVLSPFVGVADNAAANAFDGNPATNCQMHWINYANFIGADFGWNNYHAIQEVAISGQVSGTLAIQYSDDGLTYVNANTYRAVAINATPQTFTVPTVTPATGKHLYWRVNIQNSRDNAHICIGEIAMASAAGGANLLTGGVASSSDAAANAAAAIDGDPGTFWQIGAYDSPPGWWQYQFVAPTSVAEIKLATNTQAWPEVAPDRWQLLYSDDGVTFTWAQSFESGPWTTGVTQTFAVDGGIAPPPSTRRRPVVIFN